MTVKELIEKLKEAPQDIEVLTSEQNNEFGCTDYSALYPDEIKTVTLTPYNLKSDMYFLKDKAKPGDKVLVI